MSWFFFLPSVYVVRVIVVGRHWSKWTRDERHTSAGSTKNGPENHRWAFNRAVGVLGAEWGEGGRW